MNTTLFIGRALLLIIFPIIVSAQTVILNADYPSSVHPGEEFLTAIQVEKGSITGAAKLEFEIPSGFIAKKVNGRGADFSIENNIVKFSWQNLPESNEFTVSFNLEAFNAPFGKHTVIGEFVYSNGDRTEHVAIQPITINVVDGDQPIASVEPKPATPKVERKIINISEQKGEYRVELTFYPNNLNETAQFTDNLPADYSALVIDAHEASYSFENQSVIFRWNKFPTGKSFTIAYLVRANTPGTAPVINGTLVYGDAVEVSPQTVSQLPTTEKPTPSNEGNKEETPASQPAAVTTPSTNEENIKEEQTPQSAAVNTPSTNEGNIKEEQTQQLAAANPPSTKDESVKEESQAQPLASANTPPIPATFEKDSPINGIYYKVQISATKRSPEKNSEWFGEKYNIKAPVEMTLEEGWKKYMIGSCTGFKEATRLQRDAQQQVGDAFIVAYQNGKRIPVNEAIRNKPINQ